MKNKNPKFLKVTYVAKYENKSWDDLRGDFILNLENFLGENNEYCKLETIILSEKTIKLVVNLMREWASFLFTILHE